MLQEYKELKILNVVWVSGPRLTIGMVMVENKAGVRKVYVGPGAGADEDDDIRSICEWSGKLQPRSVESLFKHFGGEINTDLDWAEALGYYIQPNTLARVGKKLQKIRDTRKAAIGDRPEPDKHPEHQE